MAYKIFRLTLIIEDQANKDGEVLNIAQVVPGISLLINIWRRNDG
jgi:hypothetical protein